MGSPKPRHRLAQSVRQGRPGRLTQAVAAEASPLADHEAPYSWVLPVLMWSSLLGSVLGPRLCPGAWAWGAVAPYLALQAAALWRQTARLCAAVHQVELAVRRAVGRPLTALSESRASIDKIHASPAGKELLHIFIIPNFMEPMQVLRATLQRLADHPPTMRRRYVVVLAMEAAEGAENVAIKAGALQAEMAEAFKCVLVSEHSLKPGEAQGKGSNVNCAAQFAAAHLYSQGMAPENCMLTIMDSDAHIPAEYVQAIDQSTKEDAEQLQRIIFSPAISFFRGQERVARAVRWMDWMLSLMQLQSMYSSNGAADGIAHPLAIYSLSLSLAERVGYWDTDARAVGEDMHMFNKCFFSTHGLLRLQPVPFPISMMSVQPEGRTYARHLLDRFIQAERHARGFADFGYCLLKTRQLGWLGLPQAKLLLRNCEIMVLASLGGVLGFLAGPMLLIKDDWFGKQPWAATNAALIALHLIPMLRLQALHCRYYDCVLASGIHPDLKPQAHVRNQGESICNRTVNALLDLLVVVFVLPVVLTASSFVANTAWLLPGAQKRAYIVAPK